ncbi:MAG: hypothetical protein HY840_06065 [Bacteroidetes bacterium]|nr:hypothetical protein [Bacteroidota bacterium]
MKKAQKQLLDFEVDKLTNSIENVITGDSFPTDVLPLTRVELKHITKKRGWNFDWKSEFLFPDRDVYKLTITNNVEIVQGLISLSVTPDNVYVHLLENAPFNIGRNKIYAGVAGNLMAFACKLSFKHGRDGFVSFRAKTRLIDYYIKSLGAIHFGGHLLVIQTDSALKLLDKYFKQ